MLAIERRNEILEKLQNDRRVVVSELSQIYEVSEETGSGRFRHKKLWRCRDQ